MDGSPLEEKSSFKMLELTIFCKLDCGSYIISIAKTATKKIGVLICSMKLLSPEVALYLYLELLDKLQRRICRTVRPYLVLLLNPWLIVKMLPP